MRKRRVLVAAAAAVAASGCGFHGVYSLPLPGAEANGAHTYTVDVQMADVLDLVPYSAARLRRLLVRNVQPRPVVGKGESFH